MAKMSISRHFTAIKTITTEIEKTTEELKNIRKDRIEQFNKLANQLEIASQCAISDYSGCIQGLRINGLWCLELLEPGDLISVSEKNETDYKAIVVQLDAADQECPVMVIQKNDCGGFSETTKWLCVDAVQSIRVIDDEPPID